MGVGRARDVFWSTERVPVDERFAYWGEILCHAFGPLQVDRLHDGPFFGAIRSRSTGPLTVARIASEVRHVRRTQSMVDRHPGDSFFLIAQMRGTGAARQSSRAADQQPGDLVLVDGSKPIELSFGDRSHQTCVTIPAELLARRLVVPGSVTATTIPADGGLAAMIVRQAGCLGSGAPPRLDAEAAQRVAEHFVDLVSLALGRARSRTGARSRKLAPPSSARCNRSSPQRSDPDSLRDR